MATILFVVTMLASVLFAYVVGVGAGFVAGRGMRWVDRKEAASIPEGMIRVIRPGQFGVLVPATPELMQEVGRLLDIVEPSDG